MKLTHNYTAIPLPWKSSRIHCSSIHLSSRSIFLLTNGAGFAYPFSAEGGEIFHQFREQFQQEPRPRAFAHAAQAPCISADLEVPAQMGTGKSCVHYSPYGLRLPMRTLIEAAIKQQKFWH